MRKMLFIVAVALVVVIQSCVRKDGVWYNFVNNSADEVEFLFPIKPMSYYPFICGDMFDIDIDDTTVTSARPLFARCTVFPYDESQLYSNYTTLEEMSPYDTVRVFVYNRNDSEKVLEVDEYYYRYDLTTKDMRNLLNDKNQLEISYHPDERMKDIKMCPRYNRK